MASRNRWLPGAPPLPATANPRWTLWPARPAPWILRGRRLPAGPLRWAVVQPNAVGRGELSSFAGLGERQLLKAAGQYLAERLIIVAGEHSVAIFPVIARRFVLPCVGHWPIDRLLAVPVPAAVEGMWPAAVLVDLHTCRFVAEIRGVHNDDHTRAVLAALRP